MMSLNNEQMKLLTDIARTVPIEKRDLLLQRTAAMLRFKPRNDIESFREAVSLATVGLIQYDGFVTGLPDR